MLVIREEQFQHFIAADEPELVRLILEIVRKMNPDRVADYTDEKISSMVKIGIERAKLHGFKRAENIAAFVAIMFEIAPNFDEHEQIKLVLADTNFPVEERLKQLWERIPNEVWAEAENLYNAKLWFPDKN